VTIHLVRTKVVTKVCDNDGGFYRKTHLNANVVATFLVDITVKSTEIHLNGPDLGLAIL
jgi:hypothetical protein